MQQSLTTDTGVRAGLGAPTVVAEVESSSCGGMRPSGQAARLRSMWPFRASDFSFGDNTGFE